MSSSEGGASKESSPEPLSSRRVSTAEEREEGSREKSESPESESGASQSRPSEEDTPAGPPGEPLTSDDAKAAEPPSSTDNPEGLTQPVATNAHVNGDWQAIWSPQHGMYYFYNSRTNETTWTNPLVSDSSSAAATSASASSAARLSAQEAAAAAGIDPELAFLDPTLVAGPSQPAAFNYTAKFNAHTGAFAKPDARNPEHVSEYERMKRMNSFYFDQDAWQQDVEQRQEEEEAGKKRKKPTKKDLETFKERKKQKKLAKTAWLRT
ncbi:uncharacterized protein FOMMEDRAFT_134544 [Fomitiporia mediterranea MF3/22]|uniref:uncharacterized protein n=1 Tax=Fomitiporia mediterranea (strain MF3/22) TaxID=694068 RepID=UPI0004409A32|nr:uncharacterized protein FOMMEDRAFT_134544 [Fomitiporia mediterranea MF3/22]EJD01893.1 hypothetical protein FOMMEDRAFT_134544 [Fomitiporia mediterranea MF3/22]